MKTNITKPKQDTARRPARFFETPLGWMRAEEDANGLTALQFAEQASAPADHPANDSCLYLADAEAQLKEYFAGKRQRFDIPLSVQGTDFQRRVWSALQEIPYGETRCYQELAAAVGNGKAARAVGMANNHNPILILIPCHRVIGKTGQLTGYAAGIDRKQYLLDLEAGKQR